MTKKLTQKRKAELFEGLLNWLAYEIRDDEQHMRALLWAGMTDDEIIHELMIVGDMRLRLLRQEEMDKELEELTRD